MDKGRSLERGATNWLTGPEVASVMERFEESLFQIQVWRDLAVARYKLYDAVGMWLQSTRSLTPSTYEQVQSAANGYIEETLVPEYFSRLKSESSLSTPLLNLKVANYATRGYSQLPEDQQLKGMAEFYRASLRNRDWFYSLIGGDVFAAENETGGYTLMLAEEY